MAVYGIYNNIVWSWLEEQDALPGNILPGDLDGPIPDEEAQERSALEARLWTALDALPEMRRKCLLLAKRDGLSYKEIAQELKLSEHTVRNHISRALETLREGGPEILNFIFLFF